MPKLIVLKPKEIEKLILKKGFVFDHSKGSHKIYYNSVEKSRVIIPFHKRDLPKGTLLSILHQANLTKEDLLE